MTEADARALLRDCGGFAWIVTRRWKPVPSGWAITGELQGWSFQLEPVAGGLRISAGAPGEAPAV
jgi:hypothetical protein